MDCPHVPDLAFGELAERSGAKPGRTGSRSAARWSLPIAATTIACTATATCRSDDPVARERELDTAEVVRILDEIAAAGCLYLTITGGEPLLRRDFSEIYTHAKSLGLLVSLMTNGTLITDRVADLLADYYPFAVAITLYGMTRETYERVSRDPGSYDRCLQGIDRLLARGIEPNLRTIPMVTNHEEVGAMKAFADARGLKFQFDPLLNPRKDGDAYDFSLRLRPEEIVEIDLLDGARLQRMKEYCEERSSLVFGRDLFHCGAGMISFSVNPYGRLGMCLMSSPSFPGYDLRSGTFEEGWNGLIAQQRSRKATRAFACESCENRLFCGWCPLWSDLENDDPESPVGYLCEVASHRAEVLGWGS